MSASGSGNGSGPDPFAPGLPGEDDDLQSELDAWDRTFDALHADEPGRAAARPPTDTDAFTDEEPTRAMQLPRTLTDLPVAPAAAASAATAEASDGGLELGDAGAAHVAELAEPATIELPSTSSGPVRATPHELPLPLPPAGPDLDETDFSDLGFDGTPEDIGALLGPAGAPPPRRPTPAPPLVAPRTGAEEDEVFTSAVRPPSSPRAGGPELDLGAPEMTRVAPAAMHLFDEHAQDRGPARAPERAVRPGPAIIRRDRPTPQQDTGFEGGEATRVGDLSAIERLARSLDEIDAVATPAEPVRDDDDDDYPMIEVSERPPAVEEPAPAPAPAPALVGASLSSAGRRLAHVVRRGSPTAPPPVAAPATSRPAPDVDDGHARLATPSEIASEVHDVIDELFGSETVTPRPSVDAVAASFDERGEVTAPAAPRAPATTPPPAAEVAPPVTAERAPAPLGEVAPAAEVAPATDAFGDDARSRTRLGVGVARPPSQPSQPPVFASAPHVELALDEPEPLPPQPGLAAEPAPWELALPDLGDEPAAEAAPAPAVVAAVAASPAPEPEPAAVVPAVVEPPAPPRPSRRQALDPSPELPAGRFADVLPALELDRVALPEQADLSTGVDPTEEAARALLVIERELERIDEPVQVAALRVEAGRQYERLGDTERARTSYEAALLADPRASASLRGLRRLARGAGDLAEATRWLEVELPLAGPLERRALGLHRVDLLMAAGEQDLARVSVGELIDQAPGDVRAELAQLELAFLDGRAAELDEALGRLSAALTDPGLRATTQLARGHLAERAGDGPRARAAFDAAVQADPSAMAGWLGALRVTAPSEWGPIAAGFDGQHGDRAVTAAFALRGAVGGQPDGLAIAAAAAPDDPLVVAELVDDAIARGELAPAVLAAAERAADPALRRRAALWSAGRLAAAENVDAERAARIDQLHRAAQAAMADDDVASAARVERALLAGSPAAAAEELARRAAAGQASEFDRAYAAALFVVGGRPDDAAALAPSADELASASPAAVDVWAQVLGVARGAGARAALYEAHAARDDERLDPRLTAALAASAADQASADGPAAIRAAIAAWTRVEELGGDGERAQARALALAAALGEAAVTAEVSARAQASATSPAVAATFALAQARALAAAGADPADVQERLADVAVDDPRRTATALALAAARGDWAELARIHEQRALALAPRHPLEAALTLYRAAGIYLSPALAETDGPARAVALLGQIIDEHPELSFAHDLLAGARRRLGDAAPPPRTVRGELAARGADAYARLIRDAGELAGQGDTVAAMAHLAKALEQRPHDPLAAEPLTRIARSVREAGPITALAIAELRQAEELGDPRAIADGYEALAAIDRELRGDEASALISLEAAAAADPTRAAVLRALERAHAAAGRTAELADVRARQLAALGDQRGPGDRDGAALALDRAALLEQLGRPDDELRAAYQAALVRAPHARRPLFHLETLVRAGGASPDLLALEDAAAGWFAADGRSRAAFLTRAGDTLAELGRTDEAIARFRAADELRPGGRAALDGWREAALRGERWDEVATAAARLAATADDVETQAAAWHLAGVVLMEQLHAGERAADVFRHVLEIAPRHVDAFLRLRLLYDEQGEHELLTDLLEERLNVEDEAGERLALHRAIAELSRNFLEDRERAKRHYRALVDASSSDRAAVAALSDIAWEQGDWPTAAQTLRRRAELESDPGVLHHIHFRLGMIYAERLPDPPEAMIWFQRVLAHDPDDEAALERLADLAIATRTWKLALSACERLVKQEKVPARKVAHLHRVGRIFTETNQRQRAERAYQLAVDAAPDSDTALSALVRFYEDVGDTASIRVHLGLVAASMRTRIVSSMPGHADGENFRVLARIARARHQAGVPGQGAVARAAADVARLLGVEPEVDIGPRSIDVGALVRPEADELVWPPAVLPELRQIFGLLGDRLAKHVGVDLRTYGVTRGDRLRPREHAVAGVAQELASAFGLGEIDVYVSSRQPWAMVAEPTSPPSLILGSALAQQNRPDAIRFAAAGALKHIAAQTAIPARLGEDELGVLLVALLRLFQPDLPYLAVDADQVIVQLQRLRRLIPSSLVNELRPFAMGIAPSSLDHRALARGLASVSHRVGLVAAGNAATPLQVLLGRAGLPDLASGLAEPSVRELVTFAIGEDHGALAALASP